MFSCVVLYRKYDILRPPYAQQMKVGVDVKRGLGVKDGGIVKGGPANKLKHVMKKGKLPDFKFDDRSIFVSSISVCISICWARPISALQRFTRKETLN